jgi:GT2 family glycosyltransferase
MTNTHGLHLEIFVVDNASSDSTAAAVETEFPEVTVIRNQCRLGFSTNNNLVLSRGRGRYLMLLNDDTLILDRALDTLVQFADRHPDAGIVGAFLFNGDRTFQAAFSKFPSPWLEGIWPMMTFWPRLWSRSSDPFETDTVCGAALMIRREAMQQVGLLDTRFDPIYAEETDWCLRVKKVGWKVYAHPQARIVHYGGQTMNRLPLRKMELLQGKKALFFEKHYGKTAASFFKVALWLTSFVKALVFSTLVWRPGYKDKAHVHWHMLGRIPQM